MKHGISRRFSGHKLKLHKILTLWILRILTFKKGLDLDSCEEIKNDVIFIFSQAKNLYEIDVSNVYLKTQCKTALQMVQCV